MKEKLPLLINVTIVTCVIGLALSYVTQIVPNFPKLNFLEAIGVYCIWTPIHNVLMKRDEQYMMKILSFILELILDRFKKKKKSIWEL